MTYAVLLIFDVVCDETSKRYCSDLDDMSQVSFMCSSKLGIVQAKLRFHGGSRGKERVKELVSQVTERVLLVLCFLLSF